MMEWTHSICERCWNKKNPYRQAHKLREEFRDEKAIKCCFCNSDHNSGIYVREDPASTLCKGIHPEEGE